MPSYRWIAACLAGFLLLCGCGLSSAGAQEKQTVKSVAPGTHSFTIKVKGIERRYLLHVPPAYTSTRKWPVVVMFHGGGGTAAVAMRETEWAEKADKEGFLAVFPEGTSPDASRPARFRDNPQTWNDGSRRSNVGAVERDAADVEFVSKMLADLMLRFSVDEHRIYVTGFSNGASMAFRIARELSSLIAAAAPVAGADWLEDRMPERPVPLLYFTGTADPLNPYAGGEVRIGKKVFGTKPAIQEMIKRWVTILGCSDENHVVYDKDGTTGIAYGSAGESAKVVLYTIEAHGHHWPGGKSTLPESLTGRNTAKIRATDVIWDFFKLHPKVETTTR
jgi:polyhydroxybutyrate depolymerase